MQPESLPLVSHLEKKRLAWAYTMPDASYNTELKLEEQHV